MASGRRVGGDPCNLVFREGKVFSFAVLSGWVANRKYFVAFTLLRGKGYRSGTGALLLLFHFY